MNNFPAPLRLFGYRVTSLVHFINTKHSRTWHYTFLVAYTESQYFSSGKYFVPIM